MKAPATSYSIRDVATQAGVSVGTVSNVLNRPELVAPATRARVEEAIASLGFVRNESARQLRAGRSRTPGLVVLDVANPFFPDLARGVEEAVAAEGLAVVLCDSAERADRERRYLELLEEQRVQGILITPVEGGRRAAAPAAPARHPGGPGRPLGVHAQLLLGVGRRRLRRRAGRHPPGRPGPHPGSP